MDKEPIRVGQRTDDQLRTLITQGRGGMPGFGTRLSAVEIDGLIALVRSWQGAAPAGTATAAVTVTAS